MSERGERVTRAIVNHIELPEAASAGASITSFVIARQKEMTIPADQLNRADEPFIAAFVAFAIIATVSEFIRRTRETIEN